MRPTSLTSILLLVSSFSIWISGCGKPEGTPAKTKSGEGKGSVQLIATTGQIHSALVELTKGTQTQITRFCGPGVDPHSFSASLRDIQAMKDADGIVYNGFHLEAKLSEHLHDTFGDKSWAMASAFPESSRLDWSEDGEVDPMAPFDPHIWNHLPALAECVKGLAKWLGTIDPANAATYTKNCAAYVQKIGETHQWAQTRLAEIPMDKRFVVSAHDAFNYFAKVYELQTYAVLGIGNSPEADIQTMRTVASVICDNKIPVIFMESITNPKVTQALKEACTARGWTVEIATQQLYSDDLGEHAPQNTFLGAFRSNVDVISECLSR